jgi:hypothetical protein
MNDIDLAEAIRSAGEELSAEPLDPVVIASLNTARRRERRRRTIAIAASTMLIAGVATGLVVARTHSTPGPSPVPGSTQHVDISGWPTASPTHAGLSLRYPPFLHLGAFQSASSFAVLLFELSNQRLIDPCTHRQTAAGDVTACGGWPVRHLSGDGVVVTVSRGGGYAAGTDPVAAAPGASLTVDGHPAKLRIANADKTCAAIGGQRTLTGLVADEGIINFSACIATTDPDITTRLIASFKSIRLDHS